MAKKDDAPLPAVAVPESWKPRDEDAPVVPVAPALAHPDPFVGQVVRYLSPDGEVDGTICSIAGGNIELLIHTDEQHYRTWLPARPGEGTWHYRTEA